MYISSEEKGISSEEIAINVQLYPISSDFFGRYCLNCTGKGYFFGKNTHKCTFLYRLNFLCENQLKSTSKIFWNGWNELFFDIISEDITFISSEEIDFYSKQYKQLLLLVVEKQENLV